MIIKNSVIAYAVFKKIKTLLNTIDGLKTTITNIANGVGNTNATFDQIQSELMIFVRKPKIKGQQTLNPGSQPPEMSIEYELGLVNQYLAVRFADNVGIALPIGEEVSMVNAMAKMLIQVLVLKEDLLLSKYDFLKHFLVGEDDLNSVQLSLFTNELDIPLRDEGTFELTYNYYEFEEFLNDKGYLNLLKSSGVDIILDYFSNNPLPTIQFKIYNTHIELLDDGVEIEYYKLPPNGSVAMEDLDGLPETPMTPVPGGTVTLNNTDAHWIAVVQSKSHFILSAIKIGNINYFKPKDNYNNTLNEYNVINTADLSLAETDYLLAPSAPINSLYCSKKYYRKKAFFEVEGITNFVVGDWVRGQLSGSVGKVLHIEYNATLNKNFLLIEYIGNKNLFEENEWLDTCGSLNYDPSNPTGTVWTEYYTIIDYTNNIQPCPNKILQKLPISDSSTKINYNGFISTMIFEIERTSDTVFKDLKSDFKYGNSVSEVPIQLIVG